jgi:hypothetical protein
VTQAPIPSRLLLASDMSARCDRALDRAGWLAKEWGAQLIVVHALEIRSTLSWRAASRTASAGTPSVTLATAVTPSASRSERSRPATLACQSSSMYSTATPWSFGTNEWRTCDIGTVPPAEKK